MVSTDKFSEIALSFSKVVSAPHFDRTAFKVIKKRAFATLHVPTESANLKLSMEDQSVYCQVDPKVIYKVESRWGMEGWTTFLLKDIDEVLMKEALGKAYADVFKVVRK